MSGKGSVRQRNRPLRLLPQSPAPGPSDEGRGCLREAPVGGPEGCSAFGRYTHRIAVGNERLLGCENDEVRLRWRDYAHGNKTKSMCILAEAFIRQFLRQVLPKGVALSSHTSV
jgi:Putative transposase